jgi:RNA polymerase sigma-70 factor (ECF subfamily)
VSPRRFSTTRWSQVLAAGSGTGAGGAEALASLCEAYWHPLYAYVRRCGYDAERAQELTQEFFAKLLEKHFLRDADPARGRFRSFLLAAMRHFLSNERDRLSAEKRGGRVAIVSMEIETAEGLYTREVPDNETPDVIFERRWALTTLERALARLRTEFKRAGKDALLLRLEGFLTGDADATPYAAVAVELGMSEAAVKVAVHRLRKRYGALLRDEILQTVSDPGEVDDEIRELFRAIERRSSGSIQYGRA